MSALLVRMLLEFGLVFFLELGINSRASDVSDRPSATSQTSQMVLEEITSLRRDDTGEQVQGLTLYSPLPFPADCKDWPRLHPTDSPPGNDLYPASGLLESLEVVASRSSRVSRASL